MSIDNRKVIVVIKKRERGYRKIMLVGVIGIIAAGVVGIYKLTESKKLEEVAAVGVGMIGIGVGWVVGFYGISIGGRRKKVRIIKGGYDKGFLDCYKLYVDKSSQDKDNKNLPILEIDRRKKK